MKQAVNFRRVLGTQWMLWKCLINKILTVLPGRNYCPHFVEITRLNELVRGELGFEPKLI